MPHWLAYPFQLFRRSGPSSAAARPAPRGLRKWLFRVAAVVLGPVVFLVLLELVLRLCGFGYPTSFWLSNTVKGRAVHETNDDFGRRFFPPGLDREPGKQVIAAEKPAGTYRVFVLGESAALGVPAPAYSFSRVLEVLLRDRYPTVRFEVVNVSMAAINSHVILPIAADCAGCQPDLFVVYMGNNEVVGPFGAAGVLGPFAQNRTTVRATVLAKTTRVGQLVDRLTGLLRPQPGGDHWGGMEMFENSHVPADDPRLEVLYDHFAQNLRGIVEAGQGAGAGVVVCTMACNLADSAPFGSAHVALSAEKLPDWERLYTEGVQAAAKDPATAVARFAAAAAIDDTFADLHYRWAHALAALGRGDEACKHFSQARDLDTLRFRADSGINAAIRAEAETAGVPLVDAEQAFAAAAPGGAPGAALFYEHVHFTPRGNYVLARAVFDVVLKQLPAWVSARAGGTGAPLTEGECWDRLALADADRLEAVTTMRRMMTRPPFPRQLDHAQRLADLDRQRDELRALVRAAGSQAKMVALCRRAAAANPDDLYLQAHLAYALTLTGELDEALAEYRKLAERAPYMPDPRNKMGLLLASRGQLGAAEAEFRAALRLSPRYFPALTNLGLVLIDSNRLAEAEDAFNEALRLNPEYSPARLGLARLRSKQGRTAEARQQYAEVIRADPDNHDANFALGEMAARSGDLTAAEEHARAALRGNPDSAQTHFALASLLADRGAKDEARIHALEAARLQPGRPEVAALLARLGEAPPQGK